MIKTIYLHVGMQKTATSSIQQTLAFNRAKLKEHSICYPKSWSNWHVKEIGTLFLHEEEESRRNIILRNNLSQDRLNAVQNNIINNLKNEVSETNVDNIVISAENIVLFSEKSINKLKEILTEKLKIKQFKIILCLRERISFENSISQQMVKSSFSIDYTRLFQHDFYFKNIEKFKNIFGIDNLVLYKFEDACKYNYGPVGYFLKKIGLDEKIIAQINIKKRNERSSDRAIDLMNFINTKQPFIHMNEISKGRSVNDLSILSNIRGNNHILDETIQERILTVSKNDRDWLKKAYSINYKNPTIIKKSNLVFDDLYFYDMTSIYPKLSTKLKILTYEYFIHKKETINDIESKNILNKLITWVNQNFVTTTN